MIGSGISCAPDAGLNYTRLCPLRGADIAVMGNHSFGVHDLSLTPAACRALRVWIDTDEMQNEPAA